MNARQLCLAILASNTHELSLQQQKITMPHHPLQALDSVLFNVS